jgi:hypothetical protein
MGTFLFVAAVVGNAVVVIAGLLVGLIVLTRRSLSMRNDRRLLAIEHDRAFHHPDRIRTSTGEWFFTAGAFVVVLVGVPVVLGALFQFVLPAIGRGWDDQGRYSDFETRQTMAVPSGGWLS